MFILRATRHLLLAAGQRDEVGGGLPGGGLPGGGSSGCLGPHLSLTSWSKLGPITMTWGKLASLSLTETVTPTPEQTRCCNTAPGWEPRLTCRQSTPANGGDRRSSYATVRTCSSELTHRSRWMRLFGNFTYFTSFLVSFSPSFLSLILQKPCGIILQHACACCLPLTSWPWGGHIIAFITTEYGLHVLPNAYLWRTLLTPGGYSRWHYHLFNFPVRVQFCYSETLTEVTPATEIQWAAWQHPARTENTEWIKEPELLLT